MDTVIHLIPSFCAGGAEKMLSDLVVAQKNAGINPIVIAYYGDIDNSGAHMMEELKKQNITVHKIVDFNRSLLSKIFSILKVVSIINKISPDIINSHLSLSDKILCFISVLIKKENKLVRTIHSADQFGQYNSFYKRRIIRIFKKNIACGPSVLENEFTNQNTQFVVNNGISYSIQNSSLKSISSNLVNIIVVGSFKKKDDFFVKGQDMIVKGLEGAKMKSEICVHFLGGGAERKIIEKLVEDLNLQENVKFHGIVDDVDSYLSSGTLFLSASKFEGLPISVIEACKFGIPLFLTNIKEHQIFKPFNCTFFDDFNQLSELLDSVVVDRDKFIFDKDAISLSKQIFDINITAKKYIQIYEK